MKKTLALMSVILLTVTANASDCKKEAVHLAKMNLDSKAQSYGFAESDVNASSLQRVGQSDAGSTVFAINGSIYRAEYSVQVQVDSSCGIEALSIKEVDLK